VGLSHPANLTACIHERRLCHLQACFTKLFSDLTKKSKVKQNDDEPQGNAVPERDSVSNIRLSSSDSWFREEDLVQFSKPWLIFEAMFGGVVGFAASGLILLFAVLRYSFLIPLFVPGVIAVTVFLAYVGLKRNRILRYVAARGFKTAFYFRTLAFGFYIAAVISGALGLGYYYGYVLPQFTGLVLPFAGLFSLFIYLYLLWSRILVSSEEGRLCIFQFLVEHDQNGHGYSWLKRGLRVVETRLPSFGRRGQETQLVLRF